MTFTVIWRPSAEQKLAEIWTEADNRQAIYELATCRFIREAKDVLWLGPPGVGKSFLVQALG